MVNLVKNAVKFVPSGFIRVGAMRDGAFVRLWYAHRELLTACTRVYPCLRSSS